MALKRAQSSPILLVACLALVLPACASGAQAGGAPAAQPAAQSAAPHQHTAGPAVPAPVAPSPASAAPESGSLRIALFQFNPTPAVARVGVPVTWTNTDQIEHSVTHGTPAAPGGAFDSGLFTQGQSFTFTFTAPGEYVYFCTRHPSMSGLVQVAG